MKVTKLLLLAICMAGCTSETDRQNAEIVAQLRADEAEVEAIYAELREVDEFFARRFHVRIERIDDEKYYIIDSRFTFDDNQADYDMFAEVYNNCLGAVARAVESNEGIYAFGSFSVWADIPMSVAHECVTAAEQNDSRCLDLLRDEREFFNEAPGHR